MLSCNLPHNYSCVKKDSLFHRRLDVSESAFPPVPNCPPLFVEFLQAGREQPVLERAKSLGGQRANAL